MWICSSTLPYLNLRYMYGHITIKRSKPTYSILVLQTKQDRDWWKNSSSLQSFSGPLGCINTLKHQKLQKSDDRDSSRHATPVLYGKMSFIFIIFVSLSDKTVWWEKQTVKRSLGIVMWCPFYTRWYYDMNVVLILYHRRFTALSTEESHLILLFKHFY